MQEGSKMIALLNSYNFPTQLSILHVYLLFIFVFSLPNDTQQYLHGVICKQTRRQSILMTQCTYFHLISYSKSTQLDENDDNNNR